MKKILFISPFPPPVTGVSVASDKIIERLSVKYKFIKIDFSRKNLTSPGFSFKQFFNALSVFTDIFHNRKSIDISYLTVSQSKFGNLKDLLYIFLLRKNKIILHLHGGGIKEMVFNKYRILYRLNKILLRKVSSIIVLSKSLAENYSGIVDDDKISVISNFADSEFFIPDDVLKEKHVSVKKRILYLSNLLPGKGYMELLEAFIGLPKDMRRDFELDFAGSFASKSDKQIFLKMISGSESIHYHGIVAGNEKKKLLERASVFCLPSYFPYMEGQPISILEAYASGCVVVSTDHGGIKDIFSDKTNGFLVEKASVDSIIEKLKTIYNMSDSELFSIGSYNRSEAKKKYTEDSFIKNIDSLFKEIISI